jgi:hypothetical protein
MWLRMWTSTKQREGKVMNYNYIVIDKDNACQVGGDFTRKQSAQKYADALNKHAGGAVYVVVIK